MLDLFGKIDVRPAESDKTIESKENMGSFIRTQVLGREREIHVHTYVHVHTRIIMISTIGTSSSFTSIEKTYCCSIHQVLSAFGAC